MQNRLLKIFNLVIIKACFCYVLHVFFYARNFCFKHFYSLKTIFAYPNFIRWLFKNTVMIPVTIYIIYSSKDTFSLFKKKCILLKNVFYLILLRPLQITRELQQININNIDENITKKGWLCVKKAPFLGLYMVQI